MPDQRYRPRGWHLDPHDPTSVRYWDGERWQRVRDRPTWSLSTGEVIADTEGRPDDAGPWSGPAAERASAEALGVGAEPRRSKPQPPPLRTPAGTHGPRAGHFAAQRVTDDTATRSPWATSRRPLALFGIIVAVAIATMAVTLGWSGPHSVELSPLPSSFVAEASRTCAATLGGQRPSAVPNDAASVTTQDNRLDALAGQLRALAVTTGANPEAAGWLASWQRYTSDERRRAAILGGQVGAPAPAALDSQARADADDADNFATVNDLQSCAILARSPAGVQSIPS